MKRIDTPLKDCCLIELQVFSDLRGFFTESYNQKKLNQLLNQNLVFVQDNHSRSKKGVLRGLHYQIKNPQGKLIRVTSGQILDVALDLRKNSSTFKKSFAAVLSAEKNNMLWVPPGFAHGFLVQSEFADVQYKTTDYYYPEHERTILWNDVDLAIDWGLTDAPILSDRDKMGATLKSAEIYL